MSNSTGTVGASGLSNQAVRALHVSGSSITLLSTHYLATAHVHGSQLRLRTSHLAGLNGSVIAAAAFDGQIQQRAYAVTTDLDLLLLYVPDPSTKQAKVSTHEDVCIQHVLAELSCVRPDSKVSYHLPLIFGGIHSEPNLVSVAC